MKGRSGWPACDEDQVIGPHRQSRDHRMSVQAGTQRHCGEDLLCDPSAQGRRLVAHGDLQENAFLEAVCPINGIPGGGAMGAAAAAWQRNKHAYVQSYVSGACTARRTV